MLSNQQFCHTWKVLLRQFRYTVVQVEFNSCTLLLDLSILPENSFTNIDKPIIVPYQSNKCTSSRAISVPIWKAVLSEYFHVFIYNLLNTNFQPILMKGLSCILWRKNPKIIMHLFCKIQKLALIAENNTTHYTMACISPFKIFTV